MMVDRDWEMMLRLNGKKPSLRMLWAAFYRLYRMAGRRSSYAAIDRADCFYFLFEKREYRKWVRLVESGVPDLSRVDWPKSIRRRALKIAEKKQAFGERYEWLRQSQQVANKMREKGIETTPMEVAEVRKKLFKTIREQAALRQILLPESDQDLMLWCKKNLVLGKDQHEDEDQLD